MRRSRATWVVLSAALAASLSACGDGVAAASSPPAGPATLTVMTQNLYLGADLDLLLAPGADLLAIAEQLWANAGRTTV